MFSVEQALAICSPISDLKFTLSPSFWLESWAFSTAQRHSQVAEFVGAAANATKGVAGWMSSPRCWVPLRADDAPRIPGASRGRLT